MREGKLLAGVIVGAGAMYLLDPDRGSRRRSLLRDRGVHAGHKLSEGLAATAKDARNRTRIPSVQGPGRPREHSPELLQENWAPTTRVLVGSLGGILVFQAVRSKNAGRSALSLLGLGLIASAAANLPPRRLVRLGAGRRGIDIEKTIGIDATVDQVWELWSNFENFPRFMSHLREIRKIDEGRSHWVAVGPAGVPVEWDAIVTDWVPGQLIAWKSMEGSTVDTVGRVRFHPATEGATEISVHLSYSPPAGALGHAVATLFGADPKRAMDEDMARLKSLLEQGKTTAEGQPVRLEGMTRNEPATPPKPAKRARTQK